MNWLLNLLFAPRCLLCRKPLGPVEAGRSQLCPDCVSTWRTKYLADGGKPVAGCTQTDACLLYRDEVRGLMVRMKCSRRLPQARQWLGKLVGVRILLHAEQWKPDLVTYVPTALNHWWRRGFNLSEEIARIAAKTAGLPFEKTLRRVWFSRYQSRIDSTEGRKKNVRSAYKPRPEVDLTGKRVVLVDDIQTTGATAEACVRLLRELGAAEVYFVCAAKTPGNRTKMTKKREKRRVQS